jgi:predicted transcriptional regulator
MASSAFEELRSFHAFLSRKLEENGSEALSPEEALDLWRMEHPTPEEHEANLEAIRQGLEDLEAGRMRSAREFLAEMRRKYIVPEKP